MEYSRIVLDDISGGGRLPCVQTSELGFYPRDVLFCKGAQRNTTNLSERDFSGPRRGLTGKIRRTLPNSDSVRLGVKFPTAVIPTHSHRAHGVLVYDDQYNPHSL